MKTLMGLLFTCLGCTGCSYTYYQSSGNLEFEGQQYQARFLQKSDDRFSATLGVCGLLAGPYTLSEQAGGGLLMLATDTHTVVTELNDEGELVELDTPLRGRALGLPCLEVRSADGQVRVADLTAGMALEVFSMCELDSGLFPEPGTYAFSALAAETYRRLPLMSTPPAPDICD